jgi:aminoglycoside phosphotransferase (APT) family kinase protein
MRRAALPSAGALEEVRRLAGPSAVIGGVSGLDGGQHAATWRVDTGNPRSSVVVREFPSGDPAASHEQHVLRIVDGLDGLAPTLLGGDLDGRWSEHPTSLISWLDGEADIVPGDPERWARELGRVLALVHAAAHDRLAPLPSVFDGGPQGAGLEGPLASAVQASWPRLLAEPEVLTHCDYWSGNVVWRHGELTGVVDWSAAARGPRGFDLGWCRLDLVLLYDERIADVFLAAYESASGSTFEDVYTWDRWATARSHRTVETWVPNYEPLGRADLDAGALRERHSRWTTRLLG